MHRCPNSITVRSFLHTPAEWEKLIKMVILTLWSSYFIVKGSWRWHLPLRYHRMCLLVPLGMTSAARNTSVYRTIHLLLETCCFVYGDLPLFTSFMMTDYCMQSYWHCAVLSELYVTYGSAEYKQDKLLQQYKALNHCNSILNYLRPMRYSKLSKNLFQLAHHNYRAENSNSQKGPQNCC